MFLWKVLSSITMLEFLPVKTPALDITLLSSNTQFTIFTIALPKQATPLYLWSLLHYWRENVLSTVTLTWYSLFTLKTPQLRALNRLPKKCCLNLCTQAPPDPPTAVLPMKLLLIAVTLWRVCMAPPLPVFGKLSKLSVTVLFVNMLPVDTTYCYCMLLHHFLPSCCEKWCSWL